MSCPHREGIQGEQRLWLHSFLTLALNGGEWSTSCPACITPTKVSPYPLSGRLDGPRSWSGHFGEDDTHHLLGFKPWIVLAIVTIQTTLSWLTTIASSKSRSKNSKFGTFIRHFRIFFKIFWKEKFGMK